jgi:FixJ family two-component response regulator
MALQGTGMRDTNPSFLIIDDDPEFRDSVGGLLRTVGLDAQQFSSVSEFFNADPTPNGPTCLVVDVRLPDRSGLELQARACRREQAAPNRVYHSAWRHPDDGASHERGRH